VIYTGSQGGRQWARKLIESPPPRTIARFAGFIEERQGSNAQVDSLQKNPNSDSKHIPRRNRNAQRGRTIQTERNSIGFHKRVPQRGDIVLFCVRCGRLVGAAVTTRILAFGTLQGSDRQSAFDDFVVFDSLEREPINVRVRRDVWKVRNTTRRDGFYPLYGRHVRTTRSRTNARSVGTGLIPFRRNGNFVPRPRKTDCDQSAGPAASAAAIRDGFLARSGLAANDASLAATPGTASDGQF